MEKYTDKMPEPVYVNAIRCAFAFGEIAIDFGRGVPDEENPEFCRRIVVHPYMLTKMRDTLTKVIKTYEKEYGKIKKPPQKTRTSSSGKGGNKK